MASTGSALEAPIAEPLAGPDGDLGTGPGAQGRPRRRRPRSPVLGATSGVIAIVTLLPLVFLLVGAARVGWHQVSALVFRHLTLVLAANTVELAVAVAAGCAVIGTGAAWLVERTSLPGRRAWAVLVVLPVAIPDFVDGYAWNSAAPAVHGLGGATLVMTLALYPLVYLPVAATLRRADPSLEETARSLGLGPVATFFRVTLRQVRPALTGGCLVVTLALLAEYGAFEILRYQTFTTEIFSEFQLGFDSAAASSLSLVLVALSALVLGGESAANRRGRIARVGRQAPPPPVRHRLVRWTLPATAAILLVVLAALGVPVGTLVYWLTHDRTTTLPGSSLWSATWHTGVYSAAAAALATAMAVPVAILAVRCRGRLTTLLERSTYIVQALPGLVIALSLVFFAIHDLVGLYQSPVLLVVAYAILFFPLALICVRASVAQAPARLEEVGRSLGQTPLAVLTRITLPLVAPGLAAGFCLVFLSAVTELTATLILVPTGVHTLATQFWAFESNTSYGAAAPYAALIVAIAAVPTYVLGRYFDRRPGGGG